MRFLYADFAEARYYSPQSFCLPRLPDDAWRGRLRITCPDGVR